MPAHLDLARLAWAAGFFDGEGSTFAKSDSRRPDYFQLGVTVAQHGEGEVPEVLLRFQRAVLGSGRIDPPNDEGIYLWRARGFVDAQASIALLWRFLSEVKQAQAAAAMRIVTQQYRSGRYVSRRPRHRPLACLRGHHYDFIGVRGGRVRRLCHACDRLLERRKRAANGIPPRQFRPPRVPYSE